MKTLTNNMKKAVIELLILKLLSEEDMYGYQITQEFRRRSIPRSYRIVKGLL